MNTKLIIDISINLLRARLKQSVIAGVGVTFGIMMFIALVSFMNGLNQLLDGLILNRTPHVRLYTEVKPSENQPINSSKKYGQTQNFIYSVKPKDSGKEIYDSKAIMKALLSDERVIGISPKINTQVFFNAGNIELAGVINGVEIAAEEKLFLFSDYVIDGDSKDLASVSNSIFLGKGLADKMLVNIGDVINVTTAQGDVIPLKVMGMFQFGLVDLDNTQAYTSLATAQKIFDKPAAYITDIQIKLKDITTAPILAKEYAQLFNVDAIDIKTANAQFETGSSVRTIISYAVGVTLLIVAGFGIYNILNMMIYEKMDSIAILKATGFSGQDVKWVFIFISVFIGIAGGLLGLLCGYILSVVIDNIPFETASLPTIKTYPIYYKASYYLIGICFALVTTYIAGLFPAKKASKIDPVDIIRGK